MILKVLIFISVCVLAFIFIFLKHKTKGTDSSVDIKQNTETDIKKILLASAKDPLDVALKKVEPAVSKHIFFIPIQDMQTNGDKQKVSFKTGKDKYEKDWVYIYTDQDELLKVFPGGSRCVEVSFSDLLNIIQPEEKFAGVMVNSASESSLIVPREFFYIFDNGIEHKKVAENTMVRVGIPAKIPDGFVESVRNVLKPYNDKVKSVHVALVQIGKDDAPHFALAVNVDAEMDTKELHHSLAAALKPFIGEEAVLDIFTDSSSQIYQAIVEQEQKIV